MQLIKIISILTIATSSALASPEPAKPISWPQYELKMNYVSGDSLTRAQNQKNCSVQKVMNPMPSFFAGCVVALAPASRVLQAESRVPGADPRAALLLAGGAVIVGQVIVHREDLKHFQIAFIEWLPKAVQYGTPMFKEFGLKLQTLATKMGSTLAHQASGSAQTDEKQETETVPATAPQDPAAEKMELRKRLVKAAGINIIIKADPDISPENKAILTGVISNAEGGALVDVKGNIEKGHEITPALVGAGLITTEEGKEIMRQATEAKAIRNKLVDPELENLIRDGDYGTLVEISTLIGPKSTVTSILVEVGRISPEMGIRSILIDDVTGKDGLEAVEKIITEFERLSPTGDVTVEQFREVSAMAQEKGLSTSEIGRILLPNSFEDESPDEN